MKRRTTLIAGLAAALAPALGRAASFPTRPITLVVPYATGGMGTTFGNMMSESLSPLLGQRVINDFRPGANGSVGAGLVAKAPPDGYTLLMAVNSTMAINPNLYARLPFDPVKDFAPVAMVDTSSNILVVNPASPFRTVADVVAFARANPGKLSYGSSGNGATPHLCGEMFARMAGIKINHVPYKGNGPAVVDLIGGQIDLLFSDTAALPQIAGGRLRALAVTGPTRLGAAPDLPTMQEAGLKGFVVRTWYSIAAPAGTPAEVIERLNQAVATAVRSKEVLARMREVGVDPAEDTSSAYLASTIRSDLAFWHKFITEAGIRIE